MIYFFTWSRFAHDYHPAVPEAGPRGGVSPRYVEGGYVLRHGGVEKVGLRGMLSEGSTTVSFQCVPICSNVVVQTDGPAGAPTFGVLRTRRTRQSNTTAFHFFCPFENTRQFLA